MDQRSICLFLAIKGLSAREVRIELVAVLGLDVIGSSTITRYPRQRQFPTSSPKLSDEPPTTIVDDAILEALDKKPFSSVRELAKLTCIPATTVYRHLTKSLGFVLEHLRWLPHSLTGPHQAQRLTLSNQLLLELLSIKHQCWYFVITLAESWFYLSTDHEQIWLHADPEQAEPAKHTIQDTKIMVRVAWNALAFRLVEALSKGRGCNAKYYGDNMLTELIRFRPEAGERYPVIYLDNAPQHTTQKYRTFSSENGLRPSTHPPYSPDLRLSDFFLFAYVDHGLHGVIFPSGEE
jgi:hypothetical protein